MNATLFSNNIPLGTILLKVEDESMNVVGGILRPNEHYLGMQPIFRRANGLFTDELIALNLVVQLENRCYLIPEGGLSIYDLVEFPDEISLSVVAIQRHAMDVFFLSSQPLSFLKEPWYPIDIDQKIRYEAELDNEMGKSITIADKTYVSAEKHTLSQFTRHAYACFGPNDDVLFYISNKEESSPTFAVVHLTWKQGVEISAKYPITTYYSDFDEFSIKRMNVDHLEWD
ncbi:hypothetical protein [Chitinophaga defluvii]|uniref:DUF4241 domain-containing protein n=1 Tax=Chitinophaga defluvii TaxID=3163343 RepID=A0ABV2TCQ2_9BACT